MELNFSNIKYKEKASRSKGYANIDSNHTVEEAFYLLISGVRKEDLSYFCEKIKEDLEESEIILSVDECYELTQGTLDEKKMEKVSGKIENIEKYFLDKAYECIEKDGKHLGKNMVPGTKINTSSWISHSLYEAKATQELANILGLNEEKAGVLGILHDFGRKYIHDFTHVTRGYEALIDLGWEDEARACLIHSFINAGRCANCDPAEPGFYIDKNGNPAWEESAKRDDIADVLDSLEYDDYDMVLNIADLMATDSGIVSPYDRVQDVATRKKPDVKNRGYFLSEFTNKLMKVLKIVKSDYLIEEVNPLMDLEELNSRFAKVSQEFYDAYLNQRTKSMKDLLKEAIEVKPTSHEVFNEEKSDRNTDKSIEEIDDN